MAQYKSSYRPDTITITPAAVAEQVKKGRADDEDYYFMHVSSYPNTNRVFYTSVWSVLNDSNSKGPWKYITDQTQDYFCVNPMTEAQAAEERMKIKKRFGLMVQHLFAKDVVDKTGFLPCKVNILLTKAFSYDIIQHWDDITQNE